MSKLEGSKSWSWKGAKPTWWLAEENLTGKTAPRVLLLVAQGDIVPNAATIYRISVNRGNAGRVLRLHTAYLGKG